MLKSDDIRRQAAQRLKELFPAAKGWEEIPGSRIGMGTQAAVRRPIPSFIPTTRWSRASCAIWPPSVRRAMENSRSISIITTITLLVLLFRGTRKFVRAEIAKWKTMPLLPPSEK